MTGAEPELERNWAGNIVYSSRVQTPRDVGALRRLVGESAHVRIVGSRHSFNDIADSDDTLISLAALARADAPSVQGDRVRVPGGIRYGDLVPALQDAGRGLANLASLPHISVAGAVATGTHGSGDAVGSLATQVVALELMTADGETVRIEKGEADFAGAVVGLGALGVVLSLGLEVEPAYEVSQTVYEDIAWDAVLERFDEATGAGDSVSLFSTWSDVDRIDQVWVKTRVGHDVPVPSFLRGREAAGKRHPLPDIDATPCTPQQGVPGPWFDRLPHFRLEFTPSAGAELQSEYLVDRADAVAAIAVLRAHADEIRPLLLVGETRTMRADDLWLSPAYGRDTVGFHFTWKPDEVAVRAFLPKLEAALPASARPHWGKVHTMGGAEIAARYPRWADFVALRERLDPDRRFVNAHLARLGL